MGEWGNMSLVIDASNPFVRRRNNELIWVLLDKSDNKLSQIPVNFPPMVVDVFECIMLRGVVSKGVEGIEIVENFGTDPDRTTYPISISVKHIGSNDDLISVKKMISKFPPSYYEIEVNDSDAALIYKQVFTVNSGKLDHGEHTSKASQDNMSWTKVTFKPDLWIFNISYEYDALNIGRAIWKRCVDIAGTLDLTVTLSQLDLTMDSFAQYVDKWYPQSVLEKRLNDPKRIHEKLTKGNHNWDVSIGRSHGQFEHISFINGFPTHMGGSHVELVKATLTHYSIEVQKKRKVAFDMDDVRLFINLVIPKNDWSPVKFPSDYNLEFSTDFVEKFTTLLRGLGPIPLRKNIPNLIDATESGGERSDQCCLILSEGESANKFAIPNVKRNDIIEHEGVKNIIDSLGLEIGAFYSSAKKLRYGHLMLMMDQDHDGSHIKGLIINLLHTFCPSLLKIDGFLSQFVTPVIKVTTTNEFHEFYSVPEYGIWARDHKDKVGAVDTTTRYYKGLASHDPNDVIEYMRNKRTHVKIFKFSGPQDFNAIELAFSQNRVNDRRQWILTFEEGTFLDPRAQSITYSDFFNKEFILYSIEYIRQSIPSMVDGFKPSQRKALFTALETNLTIQKVESFAGEVCKECEYHHGQNSMSDTIVGMAQKYVGTNNINVFVPKGIFGSRREGTGTSARYLNVRVSPLTRCIFLKEDDPLLSRRVEEGKPVQPDWFLPIIPMVLVNGCEGIATGWNTKITKYDPREIIRNLKNLLKGKGSESKKLSPYFKGFNGRVDPLEGFEGSYTVSGVTVVSAESLTVQITELPVETSIEKFKARLESLKTNENIESYQEQHEQDDINFVVLFTEEQFKAAQEQGFHKLFKLVGTISTDNMHLIDEKGLLTKYSSADEILSNFYDFRLPWYEKRQIWLSKEYKERIKKLENIKRYIGDYNEDKISRKQSVRKKQLHELKYDPFDNFKYIHELHLDDLDLDRIAEIDCQCKPIKEALEKIEGTTASELWLADLAALEENLVIFYEGKLDEDPEFHPRKKQRTGP